MDEDLELFNEDATDQLQFMENALLDAKDGTTDKNKIGEIFRAMHTIKGTAGMFSFTQIVNFTHIAESLLDEVRSGNVSFDSSMCNLFIKVKDATSLMVELSVNSQSYPQELINELEQLKVQLQGKMPSAQKNSIDDLDSTDLEDLNNLADIGNHQQSEQIWHISIRFSEDFFTSGMDILSIFRFLTKIGDVLLNIPIVEDVPCIEEINPLTPFLGFEILFQSEAPYEEIHEVFEFVEDDLTLFIFPVDDTTKYTELFEKYPNIEAILEEEGVWSPPSTKNEEAEIKEELVLVTEPKLVEKEVEIKEERVDTLPQKQPLQEVIKSNNQEIPKIDKNVSQEIQKEIMIETPKEEQRTQKTTATLRVDSSKIDLLINKIGEMVIQNSKLLQMAEDRADEDIEDLATTMNELLEDVRNGIMDMRMVQVKDSFIKFRRIVNDTAKTIGKDVDFIIEGEDTELDKSVVEKLSDPLVHMLRNSIDHGIESPEVRIANGKKAKGKVILRAYPDSGTIVIEIEDDGAGINKEAVLNKAISNGIVKHTDHLSDKEVYKLIFHAGLSTAKEISSISGRGVGMDVVKKNIEDLRGVIDIESTRGKGSKLTIRLPLTLAVIDGFLVQVGDTKYIVPLTDISECIELSKEYKEKLKHSHTITVRDQIIPIIDIKKLFNEVYYDNLRQNIVIVRYAHHQFGLLVDELYGEQQTVIKPLGAMFDNIRELSGGAILGSGEVALIFDIAKLVENQIK